MWNCGLQRNILTMGSAPIFWPPDEKSRLIEKDPGGGKNWRQKEKGTVDDEMVR